MQKCHKIPRKTISYVSSSTKGYVYAHCYNNMIPGTTRYYYTTTRYTSASTVPGIWIVVSGGGGTGGKATGYNVRYVFTRYVVARCCTLARTVQYIARV